MLCVSLMDFSSLYNSVTGEYGVVGGVLNTLECSQRGRFHQQEEGTSGIQGCDRLAVLVRTACPVLVVSSMEGKDKKKTKMPIS